MNVILLIILIFLTLYDSILIFVHSLRSMCISDYQLDKIGVYEFVSKYNSYANFFMASEFMLLVLSISTPVFSVLLFLTMCPIFFYEFFLYLKGKLKIEVLWAARSLTKLKIICIVKILLLFMYMLICILKLIRIE